MPSVFQLPPMAENWSFVAEALSFVTVTDLSASASIRPVPRFFRT